MISKLGRLPKKQADVNKTPTITGKRSQRRSETYLGAETASTGTAKRSRGRPSMDKSSSTPIPSYSQILQEENKAIEKVLEETPKRRKVYFKVCNHSQF